MEDSKTIWLDVQARLSIILTRIDQISTGYVPLRGTAEVKAAFLMVLEYLPLLKSICLSAQRHVRASDKLHTNILETVKRCYDDMSELEQLFNYVSIANSDRLTEHQIQYYHGPGHRGRVRTLMAAILINVKLFDSDCRMNTKTSEEEKLIRIGISELSRPDFEISQSVSDVIERSKDEENSKDESSVVPLHEHRVFTEKYVDGSIQVAEAEDCLRVLSSVASQRSFTILREMESRKVDGTCEWIFGHQLYQLWLTSPASMLWVTGGPGKGKTMLATSVYEELRRSTKIYKTVVIQYFFSKDDTAYNTPTAVLKTLLRQLLERESALYRHIIPHFRAMREYSFNEYSFDLLWLILIDMLADPMLSHVQCILDGIDECEEGTVRLLLTKFLSLLPDTDDRGEVSGNGLQIILTSRCFPTFLSELLVYFPRIDLDADASQAVSNDIRHFITSKVHEISVSGQYSMVLSDWLESEFENRAEGTYLWLGTFGHGLRNIESADLRQVLEIIPPDLELIYAQLVLKIDQDCHQIAAMIIRWVAMSWRPLSLQEMSIVLSIGPGAYSHQGAVTKDELFRFCGHVLKIENGCVHLIHSSARSYFLRPLPDSNPVLEYFRIKSHEAAASEIYHYCSDYLAWCSKSTNDFDRNGAPDTLKHQSTFSLYSYATHYYSEYTKTLATTRPVNTPVSLSQYEGSTLLATEKTALSNAKTEVDFDIDRKMPDEMVKHEDLQSVISIDDDIHSTSSVARSFEQKMAEEHIALLLAERKELKTLHEEALTKMNQEKFVENYRRLLKQYYIDLLKGASGNLEKAAVTVLRSRWARIRIARRIVDIIQPSNQEAKLEVEESPQQPEIQLMLLERWIAANQGFATMMGPDAGFLENKESEDHDENDFLEFRQGAETLGHTSSRVHQFSGSSRNVKMQNKEPEDERGYDNEGSEDDDSEDENFLASPTAEESLEFPRISEVRRLLIDGPSFAALHINLQIFLLPASYAPLTRALMTIPSDRIRFTHIYEPTLLDRAKTLIEDYTSNDWDWWPLKHPRSATPSDYMWIEWRCNCGTHLWRAVPSFIAERYRRLIDSRGDALRDNHLCAPINQESKMLSMNLADTTDGVELQQISMGSDQASQSSQDIGVPATTTKISNSVLPKLGNGGSQEIAEGSSAAVSTGIKVVVVPRSYVLLGVKGTRQTLDLPHIDAHKHNNDRMLFKEIYVQYKAYRGFLRYWLSVWKLSYCDFVKFEKICKNRIISRGKGLPVNHEYEYRPKPAAEDPPISPHEFKLALTACHGTTCWLSRLHECYKITERELALEKIPKRKSEFEVLIDTNELAWGLEVRYCISLIHIVLYHVIILSGPFIFWVIWQRNNPSDIQGAAVPAAIVIALLSLFWSSAGVLRTLRDPWER